MAFPLIPVLGSAAIVALLALTRSKGQSTFVPERPVDQRPDERPAPAPPPPPNPVPFPSGASAVVIAPSGLTLRAAPNEGSQGLLAVPKGGTVGILETTTYPATAAAPTGWFHVVTVTGTEGFMSAQWLDFGTAKERAMTPEEELAYHQRKSEHVYHDEAPVEISGWGSSRQPAAGQNWLGGPRIGAPLGRPFPRAPGPPRPATFQGLEGALLRGQTAPTVSAIATQLSAVKAPNVVLDTLMAQYGQGRAAFWEIFRDFHRRLRANDPSAWQNVNAILARTRANAGTPQDFITIAAINIAPRAS